MPLIDTIPTCTIRWAQLPPALMTIDQVFQKLNQTLKDALAPFQQGPNGNRWVYVDIYPKFKGHCDDHEGQDQDHQVEHPEEPGQYTTATTRRRSTSAADEAWFDRGLRRHEAPRLPATRPHIGVLIKQEPDHQGYGRVCQRRRPRMYRRRDLGGRHDRPWHDAAEMEAGLRRSLQCRHLSIAASGSSRLSVTERNRGTHEDAHDAGRDGPGVAPPSRRPARSPTRRPWTC